MFLCQCSTVLSACAFRELYRHGGARVLPCTDGPSSVFSRRCSEPRACNPGAYGDFTGKALDSSIQHGLRAVTSLLPSPLIFILVLPPQAATRSAFAHLSASFPIQGISSIFNLCGTIHIWSNSFVILTLEEGQESTIP